MKLQKPSLKPPSRKKNMTTEPPPKSTLYDFKTKHLPLKGPNVANAHSFLKQKARDQRSMNTRWFVGWWLLVGGCYLMIMMIIIMMMMLLLLFCTSNSKLYCSHFSQNMMNKRVISCSYSKLDSDLMPNNWAKSKSSMVVVVRCCLPNVTAS